MASVPLLDRLVHPGLNHGQMISLQNSGFHLRAIEINQVGHFRGHQRAGVTGFLQQMTFEIRRGFREAMGEVAGVFQLPEGHGPAVLPMKREPREGHHGQHNPAE